MTKTLKSIEIDEKKRIYKINGEEMDIHQNWFKIECFDGKWHLEESIDVFYYPEEK